MLRAFLALVLALLTPAAAFAQGFDFSNIDVSAEADPFSIRVSPQYPAPYSSAILSLVSGTVGLSAATVAVSVGGREIYKGSAKPVAIELGRGGVAVSVQVRVTSGSVTHAKSLTIVPQDVTIVTEPIASAPVLYKGKPLTPLEGRVRLIAMAGLRGGGRAVDPSTASYAWTVDGVQQSSGSGIGKSSISVDAPLQYRERTVSVVVTSADGVEQGGASITLAGSEPTLRVYENDPLLGIRFERALGGTYAITGTEASVYAAPFSFPTHKEQPLMQWFLSGTLVQTGNSVTLRPTGGGRGGASLSAVASLGNFSKATAILSISFGTDQGFNLFGL